MNMRVWLMVSLLTGALVAPTFAASEFGVVDMERVAARYSDAIKLQEELKKRRETFQATLDEKTKKFEEFRKKAKKEDEVRSFAAKIESELKPKQEELVRYEQEQNMKMFAKIVAASDVVAKKYGVGTVVDKRVVLSGGYDMTDALVVELNKTK